MWQQDPRNNQILFLSIFLVLGISTRDWTLRPDLILVVIVSCLLTQWLAAFLWSNPKHRSAIKNSGDLSLSFLGLPFLCLPLGFNPKPFFQTTLEWCKIQTLETILNLLRKKPNCPQDNDATIASSPKSPSLKSAMITALSLSLLLRADNYSTIVLAGSLGILSKFIFRVEGKHFFNPANFGIIAVLILTNDAWVSPGQWGDDGWYGLLFAGTGSMVLKRVGRWDTTAAFLGAYAVLEGIRNLWLGWSWDVFCHRLMSGSFLLFALFMLTDPRSIPNAPISRLLWAVCIALLTFILRNQFFMPTAIFWALFALSPLSVLLDFIWSSTRFSWDDSDFVE
ncbi:MULTISPECIES: RnfABCDGE type electron transport complex subunit D [unclassified Moorena]|uniref:RnfABCDGE type electron transport complex subunit D n=1 Tax=unclassified Moorena TaxID=2683338 RepID=UPI0013CDB709|nr:MULTISPECIES: RnfABCDGE type electron transport complex subunit D [unclassified Moorena]NEO19546.1 Na+-transporting NADH:ubiquinone oxidoreductase, subunit NqrB [Moorena sp. SIO4A5]NEQ60169.1 Na+-transporting NADH:ubiquinone oxidoreductase, subunit NqrB [Moorena sp. SIO4A1]